MPVSRLTLAAATLSVCAVAAVLAAQLPDPASPQARFKSGTDLVQIDVVVLDKKRQPVHGLTASDFVLLVDGRPRPIEAFTEITLPDTVSTAASSWDREIPHDVVSNQSMDQEGRIVILFMDRSIPIGVPTLTAKRIAAAIVNALGPGDLGAVVSSSGGGIQNLTADRARLLRAVNRSDLSTGISEEAREIEERMLKLINPNSPLLSPLNDGRCMCGVCVLDAVTQLAEAVRDTPRRRKILFFIGSDLRVQAGGMPVGNGGVFMESGCELPLRKSREAMFAALTRANVTVHSVDPRGLENVSPATRVSSTLRGREMQEALTTGMAEHLQRQNSLSILPDLTGGRTVINTNAPDDAVPGIFRESASYYVLGFRAAGDEGTTGAHKIAVTARRDDLRVHARNGYTVAPAVERPSGDALPESLRNALEPLLPSTAIPLEVQAATFAAPGAWGAAVMLVVGLDAAVNVTRGPQDAPFDLLSVALDPTGRSRAMARSTLDVTVARDTGPRQHVDVFSGFELKSGDYEIRVAGSDGARGGSVFTHVTVPAFGSEPLSLSSILFGEIKRTPEPGSRTPAPVIAGLTFPVVPTARREFNGQRRVTAFVRIYQGTARTDAIQPVTIRTFLVGSVGQTISSGSGVIAERQFDEHRSSDYLVTLPVSGLEPGEYALRIEATMGKRTTERAVRFTIARP